MLCRLCVIACFDGSPWIPCACVGTAATLYCMLCTVLYTNMPCTVDTTTWVGTAIALYYMLCTTDTATCMGTAIALYYICYALRIPPHAWVLPLLYTIYVIKSSHLTLLIKQ